jgi:DNA-binding response OmpR family regulator
MQKILIIEDDQIIGNIYRNKFSVEGFQVEIARDGLAGLEMVRSFRPDAVILDLMLPKLTGVEVMKQIRAEADFKELPVIAFSNTYLTNMIQDAWKAGANKCLSKANCTPKQVIEAVRNALAPKGAAAAAPPASGPASDPTPKTPGLAQPASAAAPAASNDADAEFQADLRKSFIEGLPTLLVRLRLLLQGLIKDDNEATRLVKLSEMHRRIRALTGNAGLAGVPRIARLADALEALLEELHERPKTFNASTLRTVASAIDFLAILFERAPLPENGGAAAPMVLVVDDEAISRRAVTYALDKAKLKSVSVEDPAAAYDLLAANQFDLVFLDVDMPGMNGFELCTKLRTLPAYKKTPVVFVTALNDFESRANSTMSGGTDLIAKPFLFIELAVKALVYLLRARVDSTARA